MKRHLLWMAVAAATLQAAAPASAEICVYLDSEGRTIYSNVNEAPPKGAKKLRCFKEAQAPAAESVAKPAQSTEAKLPNVDAQTQKRRDDERRRILESELASEQQQLDTARKALAEQESIRTGGERNYQRYLERVEPYRKQVETHERNVQALQQELRTLR
jgi:hypothetical protein